MRFICRHARSGFALVFAVTWVALQACSDPGAGAKIVAHSDRASAQSSVAASVEATITPNTDLRDAELVNLRITGLPQGAFITMCLLGGNPQRCGGPTLPNATVDASGVYETPVLVRRSWDPNYPNTEACWPSCEILNGPAYACDTPGSCALGVSIVGPMNAYLNIPLNFGATRPSVGSVQLASSTVAAGGAISVSGSGFAGIAHLRVSLCRTGSEASDPCRSPALEPVSSQGTFAVPIPARSLVSSADTRFQLPPVTPWQDCTIPGSCVIQVEDATNGRIATSTPVTVTQAPLSATARIDLRSQLVQNLDVRVVGENWPAGRGVTLLTCSKGTCGEATNVSSVIAEQDGTLRAYTEVQIPAGAPSTCDSLESGCSLLVVDSTVWPQRFKRVPFTFATGTEFAVTSYYEPSLEALFQDGVRVSGRSPAELQRFGSAAAIWLMTLSGVRTGQHFSINGASPHETAYGAADYRAYTKFAARFDYTLEELQKSGAIFWSWYITGMPPLPQ